MLKNNFYMLRFVLRFSPSMLVYKIILSFTAIIVNISFNIFFLKYVVDSVEYGGNFGKVVLFIVGIGVIVLIDGLLSAIYTQRIQPCCMKKIHKGMHTLIFSHVQQVELAKYDDPAFYDQFIWALNEADSCAERSFSIVVSFFTNIITALCFSGISLAYDPTLFFFAIVPLIVSVLISSLEGKQSVRKQSEMVPFGRRAAYAQRVMYQAQYAKELRLYPEMNGKIVEEFNRATDDELHVIQKYSLKLIVITFIRDNFQFIFGVLLMALYISWRVIVKNELSAGVFVAMFTAVNNFTSAIGSIFDAIPKLKKNALYAEKVIAITGYQNPMQRTDSPSAPNTTEAEPLWQDFSTLEFRDVCFRYPGSEQEVLSNISFTLHRGEKLALCGINGAGKTTLIKLLLRLYDPTAGEILWNGTNIRDIEVGLYRRLFQTVFQDYQLYAYTLGENILMRTVAPDDKPILDKALENSELTEWKEKKDTPVTREFSEKGMQPSGGQAQKIAIARAFAHEGQVMVMDEASSALDPISEHEINWSMVQHAADKTMVIVSHRLSTIQYADRIFYLENGHILEQGTHHELIQQNGKYATMYDVQAESYRQ